MELNEYQKKCKKYDVFKPTESFLDASLVDKVLGLVGEAGEVADKIKKIVRDKESSPTEKDLLEIAKELGDTFWYLSLLSDYLGFTLEEISNINLEKLESRQKRDKISGSGDNR